MVVSKPPEDKSALQGLIEVFGEKDLRWIDSTLYVKASSVTRHYRRRFRNVNQRDLIDKFKLYYRVFMHDRLRSEVNIDIFNNKEFNYRNMDVFLKVEDVTKVDDLQSIILYDKSKLHKNPASFRPSKVVRRNGRFESNVETMESVEAYNVVELEEHEMFRTDSGHVVRIEIRGERSIQGILFKASDVGSFFGIANLSKTIISAKSSYIEGEDYLAIRTASGKSVQHNSAFLTFRGLFRVVFVSTTGNHNKMSMLDWSLNILYTFRFGNSNQKTSVANDLLRYVINPRIGGVYFVELGQLQDLYSKMKIDKNKYPPDKFGSYHIGKFGQTENLEERFLSLRSSSGGYGKYQKYISFKWILILNRNQLNDAEKKLKALITEHSFSFPFVDHSGRNHRELILYEPERECGLREIYKTISRDYPSSDNMLLSRFTERLHELELQNRDHAAEINKVKLDHAEELRQIELKHCRETASLKQKLHESNLALLQKDVDLSEARRQSVEERSELLLELEKARSQIKFITEQ